VAANHLAELIDDSAKFRQRLLHEHDMAVVRLLQSIQVRLIAAINNLHL
jgi:hypothetical protein